MGDCDEGDIPLQGRWCKCGQGAPPESTPDAMWPRSCPWCDAVWPENLQTRYPYDGGPKRVSWQKFHVGDLVWAAEPRDYTWPGVVEEVLGGTVPLRYRVRHAAQARNGETAAETAAVRPRVVETATDEPRLLRGDKATSSPSESPVPMLLWCPACGERHIDVGEFATKVHHTHACQDCGVVWRPAVVPTVGVRFLPGFKNEEV